MPYRRSRTSVSRGTRRKFVWARHQANTTTTGQTFGSDLLSQFETAYGAQLIGCTIVRIRGIMYAMADSGVGTVNTLRFGVRVASGAGLDLSMALPDAEGTFEDESADWMLWEPFATVVAAAGTAEVETPDQLMGRVVDVKASRKIEELNERLVMVFTPNPAAPLIEWAVGWDLSIGVKLP